MGKGKGSSNARKQALLNVALKNEAHHPVEFFPVSIKPEDMTLSAAERIFLFLENGVTLAVMGIVGGLAGFFIDGRWFVLLCIPISLGLHRSKALNGISVKNRVFAYLAL